MRRATISNTPENIRADIDPSQLRPAGRGDIWVDFMALVPGGHKMPQHVAMLLMSCGEFHREMEERVFEELEFCDSHTHKMESMDGGAISVEEVEEALEFVKYLCGKEELDNLDKARGRLGGKDDREAKSDMLHFATGRLHHYKLVMESILRMPSRHILGYMDIRPVIEMFMELIHDNLDRGEGFYVNPKTMDVMSILNE